MSSSIEVHFQEGFDGETVVLYVDDAEAGRLTARTRMQIGLAHIEKLQVRPGQTIAVRLPDQNISATHVVAQGKPFLQVNLEQGNLRIHATENTPGYM